MHLLEKYKNVPRATRQRHSWSVMSLPARWECIDLFGCEYKNCPEKAALLEIQQARKKGTRDPVLEDRLFRWGAEARICSSCKYVSYCGRDCQTADWQNHKAKCKEETAKGKDEEI
ncbi:hypothetical protein GLOTRDRAFT_111140 [Gloeophyllum trabeum ATCC 11539]|uniref:MYND-type domain-containing protein n=1 Tax=Gloeophyllum trabeum (strain ATCC 11539 / FP-39264 / Madison 617) TaxID=670483 RepID=S7Q545_GLOTA|nr:uncharacterized protein GLOTRDRAFT_111140 [Gloeophyllum trabeum ATCC 11539]EPQ55151.1 hypothetical protein GLOTRDRAFT_111140 [Gloeophyllum trabeum ATCC 11539]